MKQIIFIVLGLLFIVLTGCQMDLFDNFDYTPMVEMTSVTTSNDTTYLLGTVLDEGHGDLNYVGFAYNTIGNPRLDENQIVIDEIDGLKRFSTYLIGLNTDSTYYFRAFAVNNFEYVLSSTMSYQVPLSGPPVVPCSLTNNIIVDNGASYPVSSVSVESSSDYYELRVSCYYSGGPTIYFYFKNLPQNGIYTTNSDGEYNLGNKEVCVKDNTGYTGFFVIHDNENVYVENSGDSLIVSFCALTYSNSSIDLHGKYIKVLN